ncbi:MAG: DUF1802 family protein [Dehalococcoidia bacterium]|tara:strand:+ start:254 stop:829 length:576 start_codon:yes stop_codon:yes gene_type:complete
MVSTNTKCQIAFKEWAVAVDALMSGEQVMLIRKGGISEDSKHFTVIHDKFLLYPTYEHQALELIKPSFQKNLEKYQNSTTIQDPVTFSSWAEVIEVIELSDKDNLDSLSQFHIWTNDYAESRLRWKPSFPLSIMILKVHLLKTPLEIPYQDHFGGCKSWVELQQSLELEQNPVLNASELANTISIIKANLN